MLEQIIEFSGNHALLVSAFAGVLLALTWSLITDAGGKDAVDPLGATELINHEDAVVVDVRSIAEYNSGHVINAVNIPLNGFKDQMGQLEKHKARPIIACCRSGSRSGMVVKLLRKSGFERVHNLRGGMLAWENANLPVKRRR